MAGTLSVGRVEARTIATVRRLPADAYGVATLLLLTAVVAWDRLGDGQALSRTDILTFYLPWYSFLGEHLRAFDIPGWNPHVFSGAPFAGDPQSGWMYLPAMLFFTLLPPVAAFTVFVLFHLIFGGLTTYALARVLGMRVVPSVLAGVAFEFGTFLEHTRCCTIRAQLTAWIPLALLSIELMTRARSPLARLGWLTVTGFAVSQMLAAWVGQGAYNGLLAVGGYLFFRTVLSPPNGWDLRQRLTRLVVDGAATLAIGFGLAAAGLLPRLAAVSRSNLAGGEYAGTDAGSNEGWVPIHLLYRTLNDEGTSVRWYAGGATVALALLAPLAARRRYAVPFFAVYSVVVVILALDDTPLHALFYLLPKFQDLHEHVRNRVLAILPVGTAILAAATVETLPRWSRRWWAPLAAFVPLGILLWLQPEMHERDWEITSRTLGAVAVVGALITASTAISLAPVRRRLPRVTPIIHGVIPVLLVVVVFWDPTGAWYGRSLRDTTPDPHPWQTVEDLSSAHDPGGAGAFLQERREETLSRYFGYDAGLLGGDRRNQTYQGRYRQQRVIPLLVNNRAIRLGIDDVQGYNPVQVEQYVELINVLNGRDQNYHDSNVLPGGLDSPLLDLLNVRYVVVPAEIPPGRPDLLHLSQRHDTVFTGNGVRVLERASALPRAWIVHEAREVEDGEALDLLARGAVDPRQTALLETHPPALAAAPDAANEAVSVDASEADRIVLDVSAAADGMVVLSEVYSPGWQAYLDGESVPVHVADHVLRAIPVPAGDHTLELRYEPPWLQAGLAITGLTAFVLAAAAAVIGRRRLIRRWA